MFLNNRKKITSCFDGLNIPSYLAYSTFLVITNRDFYGLVHNIWTSCIWISNIHYKAKQLRINIQKEIQQVEDACIVKIFAIAIYIKADVADLSYKCCYLSA